MLLRSLKPGKTPPSWLQSKRDEFHNYDSKSMSTLIEHILKLTDHRDRDLLELTLSKALLALIPIQRIVIVRVVSSEGEKRWLEVARLDAKGGGKVVDPMHVDFSILPRLEDASDRLKCLQSRTTLEIAWAGEEGPRINLLPLFSDSRNDDAGVIELHSEAPLTEDARRALAHERRNPDLTARPSDRAWQDV